MSGSLDDIFTVLREGTEFLAGLAALIAALRAGRAADKARVSAETAHDKAAEAVKQQISFALKRSAKDAVAAQTSELRMSADAGKDSV